VSTAAFLEVSTVFLEVSALAAESAFAIESVLAVESAAEAEPLPLQAKGNPLFLKNQVTF
jgi:hypothetical protein